jgi:hypothetical protein
MFYVLFTACIILFTASIFFFTASARPYRSQPSMFIFTASISLPASTTQLCHAFFLPAPFPLSCRLRSSRQRPLHSFPFTAVHSQPLCTFDLRPHRNLRSQAPAARRRRLVRTKAPLHFSPEKAGPHHFAARAGCKIHLLTAPPTPGARARFSAARSFLAPPTPLPLTCAGLPLHFSWEKLQSPTLLSPNCRPALDCRFTSLL